MLILKSRCHMAGGRPKRGEERTTSLVRVNRDVAEMIKWVCDVRGVPVAQFLDPMIRALVVNEYSRNIDMIRQLHASRGETTPLPGVAVLTGKETPEQMRAIIDAADAEQRAFNEAVQKSTAGDGEEDAASAGKPKAKRKKK
jgi:hypothetical protein